MQAAHPSFPRKLNNHQHVYIIGLVGNNKQSKELSMSEKTVTQKLMIKAAMIAVNDDWSALRLKVI